jgi:methyltransferase family protein
LKHAVLNLPCPSDVSLNFSSRIVPILRHPVFAWLGMRPVVGQHSAEEHSALKRWAEGRHRIVEIGVAEGVSALALREGMVESGKLYLIDPYHFSRIPALNFMRRAARRAVASYPHGEVIWIQRFSFDAARNWRLPIDLLLIDGDHSESGVLRDWEDWSRFVVAGGIAIFHDARTFEGGWPTRAYGPVKLVNRVFRKVDASEWIIVEEIHSLVIVQRQNKKTSVRAVPPQVQ